MATKKPREGTPVPRRRSTKTDPPASRASQFIISATSDDLCPLALNTRELVLNQRIVPPPGPGRDRTQGDKDRFRDRNRGKLDKNKLKDILTNNPVFGDKGKVRIPIEGGKEPRWRPGRDGKGGGKGGRKGGKDPGDLVYVDIDYEEFVEWMFEDLELPFLEKTDQATTLIKTYKMRGLTDTGPEPRIDWEETEIRRIERGVGMLNAHPEDYPVINDFVHEALIKAIDALKGSAQTHVSVEDLDAARATLVALHETKEACLPLSKEAIGSLNKLLSSLNDNHQQLQLEPEAVARLQRTINALRKDPTKVPMLVAGNDIPGKTDAPLQDDDFIYRRVEVKFEPDSKAVAFLVLDRSGSMGGDPLAIAKFYFLLNVLFLRTRYKDVQVVLVAHDAQAYEIEDESKFYQIEVGGGTMFGPAYEKVLEIAQDRYPVSSWNRYVFHATDGYMFDGEDTITDWWTRLISPGPDCGTFRYGGYLEIDPWGGRTWTRRDWAPGGQAILALDEAIRQHVGAARVSSMDEVMDAFKAILTGERTEA
jgi:uncharacterized sporulation protein YeaH/YhbH (DUF444 family)